MSVMKQVTCYVQEHAVLTYEHLMSMCGMTCLSLPYTASPGQPCEGLLSVWHEQMNWNSYFCARCDDGGELLACDGPCLHSFHLHCLAEIEGPSTVELPEAPWCRPA